LNAEEESWNIVKASSAIEDYTMFLDEYPSSRFSGAAKLKIQQLKRAQRAKTLLASVEPTVNETKVVKEGPYTKYPNGIVYDSSTGLEWYPGPKRSLSWESAQLWVNNIKDAGGNWRMPTRNEIRSLYQQGIGNYNRTSLINTLGWYFWCAKTRFSLQDRWYFTFILGTEVKAEDLNKSLYKTIAVRKRK
jgi:hypothetical protein